MNEQRQDTDMNRAEEQGLSRVSCSCGFYAIGRDDEELRAMLDEHPHPGGENWLDFVFSFWGFAIIATVAVTIAKIIVR